MSSFVSFSVYLILSSFTLPLLTIFLIFFGTLRPYEYLWTVAVDFPIVVLEGGYDLNSLANSALTHVNALAVGYPKATISSDSKSAKNRAEGFPHKSSENKHASDDVRVGDAATHGGNEAAALAEFVKEMNLWNIQVCCNMYNVRWCSRLCSQLSSTLQHIIQLDTGGTHFEILHLFTTTDRTLT